MTRKVYKRINIGKFMKLWKAAQMGGDPKKIIPNLPEIIKDEWKWELMTMFNELKNRMTYPGISNAELKSYAQSLTVPPRSVPYADRRYIKQYPETYKKTGELYRKMKSPQAYENIGKGRKVGLKIKIPLKEGDVPPARPDTYRTLENNRSYVKAAFLRAWPKILEQIMEKI